MRILSEADPGGWHGVGPALQSTPGRTLRHVGARTFEPPQQPTPATEQAERAQLKHIPKTCWRKAPVSTYPG